jgi:hypothetical protein
MVRRLRRTLGWRCLVGVLLGDGNIRLYSSTAECAKGAKNGAVEAKCFRSQLPVPCSLNRTAEGAKCAENSAAEAKCYRNLKHG